MTMWFTRFSTRAAKVTGHYLAFVVAFGVIVVWAVSGPFFAFTNTWQLVINTGTTIVTFLMVFLIQHTQNRDTQAIHLKLDELIRSIQSADDDIIGAEDETDEHLAVLKRRYQKLSQEHRALKERVADVTGVAMQDADTSTDDRAATR